MRQSSIRSLVLLIICWGIALPVSAAHIDSQFTNSSLPQILPSTSLIIEQSDSVFINERLLTRGREYSINGNWFDFSGLTISENDTVRVVYHTAPSWLKTEYGFRLPEVTDRQNMARLPETSGLKPEVKPKSDITIDGTKTFRLSSSSNSSSGFSQSLDLSISGQLTENIMVSGVISDRGYNPVYGYSNSRLDELDKMRILLKSERFTGQLGDISLTHRTIEPSSDFKKISGVAAAYDDGRFSVNAAVARPKGRYQSVQFQGTDGKQGPYQITSGTTRKSVVPKSEKVWLDGVELERGAENDYIVDYPLGQVTFSASHVITSRSRIEIDYEPQENDFKQEFFTAGTGVATGDSLVSFEIQWQREGDDESEFVSELFSVEDQDILTGAGDNQQTAVRSGVRADTTGEYILVVDSLPDSVYQYVGSGNGDYTVVFSYIGADSGSYRFLGNDRYEYVGTGNGEYEPVLFVPLPNRSDYLKSIVRFNQKDIGQASFVFRHSSYDRNLLSDLDDGDNKGSAVTLNYTNNNLFNDDQNTLRLSHQQTGKHFVSRERVYRPDIRYNFMVPSQTGFDEDEALSEASMQVLPFHFIAIKPSFNRLNYTNSFTSNVSAVETKLFPAGERTIRLRGEWLRASLDTGVVSTEGTSNWYTASGTYRFTEKLLMQSEYQNRKRINSYTRIEKGTRYDQATSSVTYGSHSIAYEYYEEDTLLSGWEKRYKKQLLSLNSTGELLAVSYRTTLAYQEIEQESGSTDNFLGRLSLKYSNHSKRLSSQATYYISDETRNSRGITYLEVETGQGDYIFEDSVYIPDPNGNFIRIEEILSDQSRVKRAEKTFSFSKQYRPVSFRFTSQINEELLQEGSRSLFWVLPFYSDHTEPYFYYLRRYDSDVRFWPISNGYAVNIRGVEDREVRTINADRKERHDYSVSLNLRQLYKRLSWEETIEYFERNRDSYFNGGGDISGYKLGGQVITRWEKYEVTTGLFYRRAENESNSRSEQYLLKIGQRGKFVQKAELRGTVELYYQSLDETQFSYLLTDNKAGEYGAVWNINFNFSVKDKIRFKISMNGRHDDSRSARITGRMELVASL